MQAIICADMVTKSTTVKWCISLFGCHSAAAGAGLYTTVPTAAGMWTMAMPIAGQMVGSACLNWPVCLISCIEVAQQAAVLSQRLPALHTTMTKYHGLLPDNAMHCSGTA